VKAAVVGGGSWGSAFCRYLGGLGIPSRLWIREPDVCEAAVKTRENKTFLPGFLFPPNVTFTTDIPDAVGYGDVLFVAVPSEFCRSVYVEMAPHLRPDQIVASLTKGFETRTLKRMSQVMKEVFRGRLSRGLAVLSGPSFAREVAGDHPTALVVASEETEVARSIQSLVSSLVIRAYTSRDVVGVEVAGALKNVIAIASGIVDALEFGLNSRAALITRGLAEISQLGVSLGANRETFSGLAGIGDLVLTCTGRLSRNHHVGFELGKGRTLGEILAGMTMIAEGVPTTRLARELSASRGVEMPISEQVFRVLYENKSPKDAITDLMSRSLKSER
jgi:glycerol-3-phosphate dehydrogenase (NAD(P)+)